MMRILALAAATFFLALTSGCKKDSEENARSANISFSELAGEGFFFTDTQGVLRFRRNDGSLSTVKREDHAFLTDVDASSDGATVVVTRKPWDRSQKSEILIYRAKGVELTEEKRVLGEVARIAGDGETVFFCRPTRYVPRIGFGGNFWTDYEIYSLNLESGNTESVSGHTFFLVDDIAYDPHESNLFVSTLIADGETTPVEQIVKLNIKSRKADRISDCDSAHVCSGDPDVAADRRLLVFVSDGRKEFFYWLYQKNLIDESEELIGASRDFRYVCHPAFADQDGAIFALAASEFTSDGQPKFDLVKFADDEVQTVIPYSVFEARSE